VKRRTAARTVVLSSEEDADVRWKETLYLNLLVQLHCELTVAVCTKTALPDGRSTMHAQRHVTKRVYASPTKTRMDKKGPWSPSSPLHTKRARDTRDTRAKAATLTQAHAPTRALAHTRALATLLIM
jgi:hypothetical protein